MLVPFAPENIRSFLRVNFLPWFPRSFDGDGRRKQKENGGSNVRTDVPRLIIAHLLFIYFLPSQLKRDSQPLTRIMAYPP